jgi:regulatory protein
MFISKKRPAAPLEETRTSSHRRPQAQDKPKKLGPIKNYAVWLLGRQDYSAADLERRFTLKGYPAQEIENCLKFLKENSLQSDERFAGNRARSKSRVQGNRRITMDLKTKGIDQELISTAVQGLDEESERAIHVAKKFAGKELTQDLKTKAWRFLAGRGFGSSAIKVALASLQEQSTHGHG